MSAIRRPVRRSISASTSAGIRPRMPPPSMQRTFTGGESSFPAYRLGAMTPRQLRLAALAAAAVIAAALAPPSRPATRTAPPGADLGRRRRQGEARQDVPRAARRRPARPDAAGLPARRPEHPLGAPEGAAARHRSTCRRTSGRAASGTSRSAAAPGRAASASARRSLRSGPSSRSARVDRDTEEVFNFTLVRIPKRRARRPVPVRGRRRHRQDDRGRDPRRRGLRLAASCRAHPVRQRRPDALRWRRIRARRPTLAGASAGSARLCRWSGACRAGCGCGGWREPSE